MMNTKDIKIGDMVLYTRENDNVVLYVEYYHEDDGVWVGTDSDGEDYFFVSDDVDVINQ